MSSNNARLIELDLMEDVPSTSNGTSPTVDLNGTSKLSCQAIYDVISPSAKTFDDGTAATLIVQDLTYTAVARGTAGNSITIQYIGDGTAGAETVNVTASAIVVHMNATVIIGSTATQIRTAVLASAPAAALVGVSVSGTGSTVQAAAAATPLAGGAASEVDITENTLAIPTHSFTTGLKIRLTTTGTLPAPFMTATDYFVISVDANTVQLATSLVNALAGTAINITDQGSDGGVGTLTAVALSGASVTFRCSNDGSNWTDVQAATSISADGSVMLSQPNVAYRYFQAVKALTAGEVDLQCLVLVIGDAI